MKKQTIRLKVCIIGEPQSGKTSFIRRMMNQQIIVTFPTQQYEVNLYCVEAKSFYLEVQLWDCSRDHLNYHKYLREAYFRNTSAAILVFDVRDPKWKDKAHLWISEAYENHCYLVYAIGTKDDLRNDGKKPNKEEKGLFQRLNFSENSMESVLQEETQKFFEKYDIKFTLQSLKEPLKKTVTQLFLRMHDEYMIVSRGSLARGLSVRMPDNYNQGQMGGTYNFTNEQRDKLKRQTQK